MTEEERMDNYYEHRKIRNYYKFHGMDDEPIYINVKAEIKSVVSGHILLWDGPGYEVKESADEVVRIIEEKKHTRDLLVDVFLEAKEECAIAGMNTSCLNCEKYYSCWIRRAVRLLPELEENL